jgi:hypothetical protein
MTSRISQLISVVGGVKSDTENQLTEIQRVVTQPELLSGIQKTHRPILDESEGGIVLPPQYQHVRLTAETALNAAAVLFRRFLDVTLTLDTANAGARADVKVDGKVLLHQVPNGHLIFLERELARLGVFVDSIPVHDPAFRWSNEGTEPGEWKTEPVQTAKADKGYVNHTVVEAKVIDGHLVSPVVNVLPKDEVTGFWTTVKFSGALEPRRKRQLLDRITQLREAVKYAREEANSAVVEDLHEGETIFNWLLRP